jgi:signal transduction histidine kinase
MQSADGATENQLLFKMVPRNKAVSALQSLVGLTENVASRPGESPKGERAARQIHSRSSWLGFAGLACIPLVGWLDYKTGPAISFALFYVPPVAMSAWFGGRRIGLIAAFAGAAAWFTAGIPESAQLSSALIYCWNATTGLLIYSLVALLVAAVRQQRDQLRKIIEQKNAIIEQQNARLELEMAERDLAEREIIEAGAREQRRIAYDLHDDLGQHLVGIAFKAKLLGEKLRSTHPAQAEEASTIARLANDAARQTRLTAHKLDGDNGAIDLTTALPQLAAAVEENCRVRVSVNTSACSVPMSAQVAVQLYRIAQEAMRNAIEHGRADAVEIYLVAHQEQIVLTVSDNGGGFDPSVAGQGLGFRTMGSRAHSVGGSCEVESRDRGTTLICHVPIGRRPAEVS